MASFGNLLVFLSVISLVTSSAQPKYQKRKSLGGRNPRVRREAGGREGAQIQSSVDCHGCAAGATYTPYFSGQCFMCPVGIPGPRGPPGQQGIPGRDGRDGRDAPTEHEPGESQSPPRVTPSLPSSGGAVYVRWGRDVCPDTDSVLVYSGVAGGAHYTHTGSGSNHLCMPEEPIYDNPIAGSSGQDRGYLYGAEYETNTFSTWGSVHDNDVPCAVCMTPSRATLLMVPARNVCPGGGSWTKEYSGYLVSAYHGHQGRTEFVCMDRDPQAVSRSVHDTNGLLFYLVEGRCGSSGSGLPCGPYVDGYELTCAVCTT